MVENVLRKIIESEESFFKLWTQRMRKGGYLKYISAGRDDFRNAFAGLLNILHTFASEKHILQVPVLEEIKPHCRFILEEARLHRSRGVSPGLFLGSFKIMVQALEDSIVALDCSDRDTNTALLAVRRTVDIVETAVIEDWERSEKSDELKELESAYRQLILEKNTYENIYNATNNLVLITNHEGYIIEANAQAARLFGQEKILGRFCGDLIGISCTSVQGILDAYPPGKAHEISISNDGIRRVFDLRILLRDSQIFKFSGIMLLFNDITRIVDHRLVLERRVSERTQAQANAEKMRSAVFQSVGEGILMVDQEFEIVNANQQAAEIYGIPIQNLIETDIRMLTDEAGSRQLIGFFDELVEGQRLSAEITGIYVDGRTFPTRTTATRIDYDGKKFWTIIVHDSTEQKAMEGRLRLEKKQIEEMNITLKNVLNAIEKDRRDFENRLSARIRTSIVPALERVDKETDASVRKSYLTLLSQQLVALTSGFDTELDAGLLKLSRTEIEVCRLIQAGCSSKEICEAMTLSFETIQTHRKNIRRKLNLRGRKVNLHAFLSNRIVDPAKSTNQEDEKHNEPL
jgi:PAS domain S-box-containing protein